MLSAQALRVSQLLKGKGLARKGSLLAGLGARLSVASALPPRAARQPLTTSLESLDRLLAGGLPKGALVELSGRRSSGRFSIGLAALAAATSAGEGAALVDLGDHLDPASAQAAGVDLERLLWVRPARVKEAVAAAETLLAAGFPLVVADLGLSPRGGRFLPDAAWVRLTRAAEARGSVLLLLTPYRMSGLAAEAVLAASPAQTRWQGNGATPRLLAGISSRLTLERCGRVSAGRSEEIWFSIADAVSAPQCHPFAPPCHPERSEGSAPVRLRDFEQILRRSAPQNDRAAG